jgi:hypothetical protein
MDFFCLFFFFFFLFTEEMVISYLSRFVILNKFLPMITTAKERVRVINMAASGWHDGIVFFILFTFVLFIYFFHYYYFIRCFLFIFIHLFIFFIFFLFLFSCFPGKFDVEDLMAVKRPYVAWDQHMQTVVANDAFVLEAAKKFGDKFDILGMVRT